MFDVKLNGKNEISISIKNDIDIDNLTRQFIDFDLVLNSDEYIGGMGVSGDDAIWFPLTEDMGLKLVKDNSKSLVDNIQYIMDINSDVFPKVYWYEQMDEYTICLLYTSPSPRD